MIMYRESAFRDKFEYFPHPNPAPIVFFQGATRYEAASWIAKKRAPNKGLYAASKGQLIKTFSFGSILLIFGVLT
jgi:hypothetical protein